MPLFEDDVYGERVVGNTQSKINLTVKLGNLALKNPVTVASGTFGYGSEFAPYCDVGRLGAVVVKGINREPQDRALSTKNR